MGESEKNNDLFYVCSLVEYLARKTKNTKKYIVEIIGKEKIRKIYELASVYHCENIDKIVDELVNEFNIKIGDYDIISNAKFSIPTHWDIGKVYQRLVIMISKSEEEYLDNMIEVLNSWIIEKIDNYNSNMYYENPSYIYECYIAGKVL